MPHRIRLFPRSAPPRAALRWALLRTVAASVAAATVLLGSGAGPVAASVDYSLTDGVADIALSIDPGETIVWMNTFPVDPAGAYIDLVRVAFGRVGGPTPLNSLPVTILLYEDLNGGSPKDARLLWSLDTRVANGNTNVLNEYPVPPTFVRGTLVVGALYRNTTPIPIFIGALDTTAPTYLERSWSGYAISIDPANLGAIPPTQWGPQESYPVAGNYRIEARGRATPDGISLSIEPQPQDGTVRLEWTGPKPAYDVERALRPDFSDGQVLAAGVPGPSWEDPVLGDGQTWFYRVR